MPTDRIDLAMEKLDRFVRAWEKACHDPSFRLWTAERNMGDVYTALGLLREERYSKSRSGYDI